MSVRLTWTNNSAGHDGTRIYRDTAPMDPQALPAPIAEVDAGVEEYVDAGASEPVMYYYRIEDYSGESSVVSDEVVADLAPDYSGAAVGDEIGGGIYAGTITYADARQFHIIFGKQSSEVTGVSWGNNGTFLGVDDPDDGWANQQEIINNHDNGDSGSFYHCRDYVDSEGNADYYLPSRNELALVDALVGMAHPEFAYDIEEFRWSSTESTASGAWLRKFSDGTEFGGDFTKGNNSKYTRPIRRVPA